MAPNTSVRIAVEFGEHVPGTENEVSRELELDAGHDHAGGGHGDH